MDIDKRELKKQLRMQRSLPHKISIDILGVLMIISSGLVGWMPGPGGIPLVLAGLALLANNHDWAEKLLHELKDRGSKISEVIFKDDLRTKILFDIVSLLLFALGCFGLTVGKTILIRGLSSSMLFVSFWLFFGNRKRLDRLSSSISTRFKKK